MISYYWQSFDIKTLHTNVSIVSKQKQFIYRIMTQSFLLPILELKHGKLLKFKSFLSQLFRCGKVEGGTVHWMKDNFVRHEIGQKFSPFVDILFLCHFIQFSSLEGAMSGLFFLKNMDDRKCQLFSYIITQNVTAKAPN